LGGLARRLRGPLLSFDCASSSRAKPLGEGSRWGTRRSGSCFEPLRRTRPRPRGGTGQPPSARRGHCNARRDRPTQRFEQARRSVTHANLRHVEVRQADAGYVASFADVLPAHVLLLCGIFGNISDLDIDRTIEATSMLCSAGGTVIWTRHRQAPDHTDHIRQVFQTNGFDEVAFESPDTAGLTGVGVNRLREPQPSQPSTAPLFVFIR